MDKVPKQKTVSVNFTCTLFFGDFFTLEDGTNRLSWNDHKELPLNT